MYVAGPITGNPFGAAREVIPVWRRLRSLGVAPFCPQWSILPEMIEPIDYETWLAYDFDVIRCCEALVRLPGDSPGADREVAFAADELGLPVFEVPADWPLLERWAAELHARRCDNPDCDRQPVLEQLRRGIPLSDRITLDEMGVGRDA